MDIDWNAEAEDTALYDELWPLVRDAAIAGVHEGVSQLPPEAMAGFPWNIAEQAAIDWAKSYTYDLVKGINTTSESYLRETLSAFNASGKPLSDLIDEISASKMFDEIRAEKIAITETTRGFTEGNIASWQMSDVVKGMRWATANDEVECDLCAGLDGAVDDLEGDFDGDGPPPAHVDCRCWIEPVME